MVANFAWLARSGGGSLTRKPNLVKGRPRTKVNDDVIT